MNAVAQFNERCKEMVRRAAEDESFRSLTRDWFLKANSYEYSYHFTALGRPIIQYPQDMVAVQELIWKVRPNLIIETGIAHGGSLIQSAAMLATIEYCDAAEKGVMLDPSNPKRKVIGIDIDIREHNRAAIEAHPLSHHIELLEGSSVDEQTIKQVCDFAFGFEHVLVCLDSNHTHEHVLRELQAYAGLVTQGSYCVVFDTVIEDIPEEHQAGNRPWGKGDNPKTAVAEFLQRDDRFEVDQTFEEKILISVAPNGYLKRVR